MKVTLTVKADELHSLTNIQLTIDTSLYNHAVKRINELAVELKAMHDKSKQEDRNELQKW